MFPHVTAAQVHAAWTKMSEIFWKCEKEQMSSARALLDKLGPDVEKFELNVPEGVSHLCWGMKKIAERLRGQIIELGVDATCE